ncbi:thioredoxin family protein [Nocardia vinacea]|uniref:thioredoxin family protein n=1 Tax=Nocardia vinacea TaxID=96468 RepID=UPI00030D9DF5|nr:thioredoxin family protein [Nocardia vinacea]
MPTMTVTRNNFDATIANSHIVLIDWGAQWCEPSRRFAEVFAASADLHPEIVYGTVDIDAEKQLTEIADVSAYPTLMAFREGLLVYSEAGALPAETMEELVQQIRWLDMDRFRRELAQLSASISVGEPEQPPTTIAYQKRAGHAAVTDRYGWPGL